MLKGVIFDFDGTLVNLPIPWKNVKLKFSEILGVEYNKKRTIFDYLIKKSGKPEKNQVNTALKYLKQEELKAVNKALRGPALSLYQKCIIKNLLVAVFTTNFKETVEYFFDRNKYKKPNIIVGRKEVERIKPDPEGLIKIIKFWQLNPKTVVYIGDQSKDKIAANKSGINFYQANRCDNFNLVNEIKNFTKTTG